MREISRRFLCGWYFRSFSAFLTSDVKLIKTVYAVYAFYEDFKEWYIKMRDIWSIKQTKKPADLMQMCPSRSPSLGSAVRFSTQSLSATVLTSPLEMRLYAQTSSLQFCSPRLPRFILECKVWSVGYVFSLFFVMPRWDYRLQLAFCHNTRPP